MKPAITLTRISKTFTAAGPGSAKVVAIEDINLQIREGEFFVFVGPSGCGKSTLLRIMSGLEKNYDGQMALADGLFHKDIGFVFQQFALLPWLSVYENVELGLLARQVPEAERRPAVMSELKRFGLESFARSYPRELSGGMKQRVGIARALVTQPKLLFLDEAFSELDSFTATALRRDLLEIWKERNLTVVMVSHIVQEALELADRIAVMSAHPGKVVQVIDNTLPRPRQKRLPEFFAMEDQLSGLIKA